MSTTTVTSTLKIPCQITIQCEACDHIFVFNTDLEARSSSTYSNPLFGIGVGEKQAQAKGKTSSSVQSQMEYNVKRLQAGDSSVINWEEEKPCPKCGYLQSWMAKNKRMSGIVFIIFALGWAAFWGVISWFVYRDGDNPKTFLLIGGLPATIGIIAGIARLFSNPNKDWLVLHEKTKRDIPPPRKPLNVTIGYMSPRRESRLTSSGEPPSLKTDKKSDKAPSPISNEERLILAAKEGDVHTVKALLDAGTDVNATVQGYAGMTPLMHASRSNHIDCVKVLISAGANVRIKNELGRTALKIAEGNGNLEIVKLLEEAGARVELV